MLNVLYADDDPTLSFLVKMFLERSFSEIEVIVVNSVMDALRELENQKFDLIISDYNMPEIDGLQFLAILKDSEFCNIPFVILTSEMDQNFRDTALDGGAAFVHNKLSERDISLHYIVMTCKICRAIAQMRRLDKTAEYELALSSITDEVRHGIDETVEQITDHLNLNGLVVSLFLNGGDFLITSPRFERTAEQINDVVRSGTVEALISCPIEYQGSVLGIIYALRLEEFTDNDQMDLTIFAGLMAAKIAVMLNKSIE